MTDECNGCALCAPMVAELRAEVQRLRSEAARVLGSRGGKRGGAARAKALSPGDRTAIARAAGYARWGTKPNADTTIHYGKGATRGCGVTPSAYGPRETSSPYWKRVTCGGCLAGRARL